MFIFDTECFILNNETGDLIENLSRNHIGLIIQTET